MKVGDLVKVYDFSQRAREYYLAQGEDPKDVNRHYLAIIIANDLSPYIRTVLRFGSQDPTPTVYLYDLDRIEVIE